MHVVEGNVDAVIPALGMHHGIAVIVEENNVFLYACQVVDEPLCVPRNGTLLAGMLPPDKTVVVPSLDYAHTFK